MRLRDRLSALSSPGAHASAPAPLQLPFDSDGAERAQRIAHLRTLIGDIEQRARGETLPRSHASAPQALPFGSRIETPEGPLHVVERWFDPHHRHGRVAVRGALATRPALLARLALDPALEDVDLSRMLILDTETTGLAGGAGTVPFLVGIAWFEDGGLKLEQLFLHNFGAEAPLLRHLAERLRNASCVVSYNGKSFDWPLLRGRFILNRVALPEPPLHLDLLHCARRVLKPRMESVRLPEVERALLGHHREDDIPGSMIPGMYLAYLRGGDPRTLLPVLEHNEQDVVALAAILFRLCAHFDAVVPEDDPRDHLAYAKVALRAGDVARARAFAEAAARGGAEHAVEYDALWLCAAVARRAGDAASAIQALERALAIAACERSAARVHLALTRVYERLHKDVQRAHQHARFTLAYEGPEAHGRRLGRLRRRLERLAAAAEAV
jgi:uncharacterized protein YprB with RNaseH-like and TPR domain